MVESWVKERGSERDGISIFCPIQIAPDGHCRVVVGMMFGSTEPPRNERCIGEFWEDDDGLHVELYKP